MKPTDLTLAQELSAQLHATDLPAHVARHKTGGDDALAAADVGAAAAAHTHAQADITGLVAALATKPTGGQGAVAAMNLGALTLLTDCITALGAVQTQYNALLVKLRASGLIS